MQQKGHLPTNDAVRDTNAKLFSIIVRHLENLALTHNRNVADDPAMLGEHMLTLVEKGLSPLEIEQLASELIDNFQEANRRLKDRRLANLLEQAFVARESVRILDDPNKTAGAIFKYHNPLRHAEPLLEIALAEHGGRERVASDEEALVAGYPQFAPTHINGIYAPGIAWEQREFNSYPLIFTLDFLSRLQSNVRLVEREAIN